MASLAIFDRTSKAEDICREMPASATLEAGHKLFDETSSWSPSWRKRLGEEIIPKYSQVIPQRSRKCTKSGGNRKANISWSLEVQKAGLGPTVN